MIKLTKSLEALGTSEFEATLKNEIQNIEPDLLPLQEGLSLSSYVDGKDISVMILKISESVDEILVKSAINYSGVIEEAVVQMTRHQYVNRVNTVNYSLKLINTMQIHQ